MVDTTTKLETRTRPTSHIRSVLLINFFSHFCRSFKCSTITDHWQVSERLRGLGAGMRETTASIRPIVRSEEQGHLRLTSRFFVYSQTCLWSFRASGMGDRPNKHTHEDSSLLRPLVSHW